jgi:hypothetical protein
MVLKSLYFFQNWNNLVVFKVLPIFNVSIFDEALNFFVAL